MNEKLSDKWMRLRMELAFSPEFKRLTGEKLLRRSFAFFEGNHREFMNSVGEWEAGRCFPQSAGPDIVKTIDDLLFEASLKLANLVASARALVDHIRADMRSNCPQLSEEYQEKVKSDLLDDYRIQFINGLRNYSLHFRNLPLVATSVARHPGKAANEFCLKSRMLLEWDGWTSRAAEFIKENPHDLVNIKTEVESYFRSVRKFQFWYYRMRRKALHSDLLAVRRMRQKIRRIGKQLP